MTGPALEPDLAAAYVRELSAEITAVVVLDVDGNRLAGSEEHVARARELAAASADDVVATAAETAWIGRGATRTIVAFAPAGAALGPTALDVRAAL